MSKPTDKQIENALTVAFLGGVSGYLAAQPEAFYALAGLYGFALWAYTLGYGDGVQRERTSDTKSTIPKGD